MITEYFEDKNENEKALEYKQKHEFYSWIPDFCKNIELNEENLLILNEITSSKGVECIQNRLANDLSRKSTEFLASICYHHYHGKMDDEAFEQLELRGNQLIDEEKDFLRETLIHLLENCSSLCTMKGVANALVSVQHPNLLTILTKLLYRDVRFIS